MPEHCERDVTAHRQAADDSIFSDVELVEQIDGIAGVVVYRRRRRVVLSVAEPAKLGRDDPPAALSERQLRLPHARIERESVDEDEHARTAALAAGGHVEIAESADALHWRP